MCSSSHALRDDRIVLPQNWETDRAFTEGRMGNGEYDDCASKGCMLFSWCRFCEMGGCTGRV